MGNALLRCLRGDCGESTPPHRPQAHQGVPHGVAALAHDLLDYEITAKVPEGLSRHVVSSRRAQAIWYKKLLEAWKEAKPRPKTPATAAILVVQTLRGNQKADLEGLLAYYNLPVPSTPELVDAPPSSSSTWNDGVQFELRTLPVDPRDVVDGDGITAYVDTATPEESADVPMEVQQAAIQRTAARAARNYREADALKKSISAAGYGFKVGPNGDEILARKYRIRLRGIDAPESEMPYGKEAKAELLKLVEGKPLKIHVYGVDRYGRSVGDVHCGRIFVQERMLKGGFAWHYATYDKRPEFARWQKEARAARRGLWASSHPEKPWEWRKKMRNAGWREGKVPIEVF
uniref:TNase-like domain-containing protein n=1 Tax=Musa acuminata subsp. malaccensis TaxID=214687 RepID=A0A804JZ24_MUSAM|nr:PREDICTED: probable staphylococcal-like nuclease CAN1 [Musa acuminata subsp. malaccensis]